MHNAGLRATMLTVTALPFLVGHAAAQSGNAGSTLDALEQAKRQQMAALLARQGAGFTPPPAFAPGQLQGLSQQNTPNANSFSASAAGGIAGLSTGSLSLTALNMALLQAMISNAGAKPVKWPQFGYYNAGQLTPTPVAIAASYNGLVEGMTGTGTTLNGTAHFDVDVAANAVDIDGRFAFDNGDTITLSNFYYRGEYGVFIDSFQPFMGGTIDYTTHFSSQFYGPNAEQYGGKWAFHVAGGTDPGVASGVFATAR